MVKQKSKKIEISPPKKDAATQETAAVTTFTTTRKKPKTTIRTPRKGSIVKEPERSTVNKRAVGNSDTAEPRKMLLGDSEGRG